MINSTQVVLLPYATPHVHFKAWGVFHPSTIMMSQERARSNYDEIMDWSGYTSVKVAATISHTVVATIPPKTSLAGTILDQLMSTFINMDNILAEVERVETEVTTIADQVKIAFSMYPNAKALCVIMPYQVFSTNMDDVIAKGGEAQFAYSHPMANHGRVNIPECVVVAPEEGATKNQDEIECKDASYYSELDPLLRGPYTRAISIVEINRHEFEEFAAGPDYPNLGKYLKKTLAGKRGVLVNHQHHEFI